MHRATAATSLALSLSLGALSGCMADEGTDGGLFVLKGVAPGDSCSTMVSADEVGISHGAIDSQLPVGYVFIAQMRSRITAVEGSEDQRTILTTGARVDIAFPNSTFFSDTELAELQSAGLTKYRTLFTAPVAPNGGLTDAGFELVPAALVARINAKSRAPFRLEMVASFTVEGDMSGRSVESNNYHFPITVGRGVTINVLGNCPVSADLTLRTGSSCNPTQDGVVDCCADPTRVSDLNPDGLVCPATQADLGGV